MPRVPLRLAERECSVTTSPSQALTRPYHLLSSERKKRPPPPLPPPPVLIYAIASPAHARYQLEAQVKFYELTTHWQPLMQTGGSGKD